MNRISYHRIAPADAYQRVQQAQELRQPARTEKAEATAEAKPASATRATTAQGLSRDEAAMIDRYFPAESKTALRLYGRTGAHTVQPSALGSRLDLSA